ncbi:Hsp70 family protein [Scytonema sp. UIC 10036]|uniref:Hsp70 family protein n=1 Tax=Scytonema sp. UIC 10036 TaxID=2304196 RepID=UPI0012DA6032|nr:Hsp70 family protein [Scytonema sp. UIC 10036]MUG96841.1 Hsp70 family protein [Scytonema sp. UIC 10036]
MRLGIDFGTCYSSAALLLDGVLRPIKEPLKLGFSFPSSIFVTKQGEIVIGQAAENQHRLDPTRYCREFKRDLGQTVPYQLGNWQFLPEDLISQVIRRLKSEAETMVNSPLTAAIITVPARYQAYKRQMMLKAAKQAGFTEISLLDEPLAAAIYYAQKGSGGHRLEEGENLLVYDLGGGTFDAALIQKRQNGYKILSPPVGDENCGGIDFDRQIYADLKHHFASDPVGELINSQRRDLEALRTRLIVADWCREFKHQLSAVSEYEDILPIGGSSQVYHLNRLAFEDMITPYIDRSCELCQQLVRQANLSWDKVDRILLVGGSCRIPYVQRRLEQEFNCKVIRVDEPELAICFGAAIYGAETSTKPKEIQQNNQPVELQVKSEELNQNNRQFERETKSEKFDRKNRQAELELKQEKQRQEEVKAYYTQANTCYQQKDFQKAIALYTQVIQLNSRSAEAYAKRGSSHYMLGDFQGAIADYTEAIALSPNHATTYINRGNARCMIGDLQGAIEDCERAIQMNSNSASAYANRGNARSALGNLQGAMEDYQQALNINPNFPEVFQNMEKVKLQLKNQPQNSI